MQLPKKDNTPSFNSNKSNSLYNYIYKVITNIISKGLKPILPKIITSEQLGFLDGKLIFNFIDNMLVSRDLITHN